LYKYDTFEEEYLVEDGKFDWDNEMPKKKDEEIDEVLYEKLLKTHSATYK
jgi:hypothetical protein